MRNILSIENIRIECFGYDMSHYKYLCKLCRKHKITLRMDVSQEIDVLAKSKLYYCYIIDNANYKYEYIRYTCKNNIIYVCNFLCIGIVINKAYLFIYNRLRN